MTYSILFCILSKPKSSKDQPESGKRGPRGRGKGVTSKKITTAKKAAVDYRQEEKKSEEVPVDNEKFEGKIEIDVGKGAVDGS